MTVMQAIENKGNQVYVPGYKTPRVGKLLYLTKIGGCWYGRLELLNGEMAHHRVRYLRLVEEKR